MPDIGEFPKFVEINDSFEWRLDQWVVQRERVQLGPAEGMSDSPLPEETRREIHAGIVRAREYLKLPKLCSVVEIHQAIFETVSRIIETNQPSRSERSGLAFDFGSLWGHATAGGLKWEWCVVADGEERKIAIASPGREYFVPPLEYMKFQINQTREEADVTTFLLYNLIKAGKMPGSGARRYRMLS
jgi:hypothetical protein